MSLILDALRKSDRQRNRRAAEQLRWGPGPARREDNPGIPKWAIGLALLLLATIGLGSWLAFRNDASPEQEMPVVDAATDLPQVDTSIARPARATVRSLSSELAATPADSAVDGSTMPAAEPAPAPMESRLLAPALSEMDADFQQALPELMLNVHAWTENPEDRFVLINMQRYAEGDRLQDGLRIRQITPDGVILEFRNTLFTLSQ